MTIKQQGGIFGRNTTFKYVDVEGTSKGKGFAGVMKTLMAGLLMV